MSLYQLCVVVGITMCECHMQWLFYNATIYTFDSADTVANTIGVHHNGTILVVGNYTDVLTSSHYEKKTTVKVDMKGAFVLPGFVDAHSHLDAIGSFTLAMAPLTSPPVGNVTTIPQLLDRLRDISAKQPGQLWIMGYGYDDTLLTEKRHPTRQELDQVSTTKPIFIFHVSMHMGVANTPALEVWGYGLDTKGDDLLPVDPTTNLLSGLLLEERTGAAVSLAASRWSTAELLDLLQKGAQLYASQGVVMGNVGMGRWGGVSPFTILEAQERLPIRVNFWPTVRGSFAEHIDVINPTFGDTNSAKFRVKRVKGMADGSIQGYTGYLSQPYFVPKNASEPDYRGYAALTVDKVRDVIVAANRNNLRVAIHANGDAAIDVVLDGNDAAQKIFPKQDMKLVIIHSQMAREDQLQRMAAANIIPSFFNLHVYYWGDRHRDIFLGPDRASRISPLASAIKLKLNFTLHTDAPVVPMEPLKMVVAAVTRKTSSGKILGANQAISRKQAFKALITNAAYQADAENTHGSIEVGKLADFVSYKQDPMNVDITALADLKVYRTYVGGQRVFPKPDDAVNVQICTPIAKPSKKRPSWVIPVFVLGLVAVGSVAAFFIWRKVKHHDVKADVPKYHTTA